VGPCLKKKKGRDFRSGKKERASIADNQGALGVKKKLEEKKKDQAQKLRGKLLGEEEKTGLVKEGGKPKETGGWGADTGSKKDEQAMFSKMSREEDDPPPPPPPPTPQKPNKTPPPHKKKRGLNTTPHPPPPPKKTPPPPPPTPPNQRGGGSKN